MDSQADKGGYFSVFFMALALVIVSFSCTMPFIGFILIEGGKSNFEQSLLGMMKLFHSFCFAVYFFCNISGFIEIAA